MISASIVNEFSPSTVIDIGCGTGALLNALRERGCEVKGLEYAEAALEYCRSRNLDVSKFDLEKDSYRPEKQFDVAVSTEVAEHLPESVADRYVDLLTSAAPAIVFTAAPPGQEGADHINLQPASYWHSKFKARGFDYDPETSERWKAEWKDSGEVQDWYYWNLMIFRKAA